MNNLACGILIGIFDDLLLSPLVDVMITKHQPDFLLFFLQSLKALFGFFSFRFFVYLLLWCDLAGRKLKA